MIGYDKMTINIKFKNSYMTFYKFILLIIQVHKYQCIPKTQKKPN